MSVKHARLLPLPRTLASVPVALGLAAAGVLAGIVPEWDNRPTLALRAHAQSDISQGKVRQYAQAMLKIERLRQRTYQKVEQRMGAGAVPNIACHRSESLSQLSPEVRKTARSYCKRSRQIVRQHDLTVSEVNRLNRKYESDPAFKERVGAIMRQLQSN